MADENDLNFFSTQFSSLIWHYERLSIDLCGWLSGLRATIKYDYARVTKLIVIMAMLKFSEISFIQTLLNRETWVVDYKYNLSIRLISRRLRNWSRHLESPIFFILFIYKLRQRRKNNMKKPLTGENSQNDKFQ